MIVFDIFIPLVTFNARLQFGNDKVQEHAEEMKKKDNNYKYQIY